MQFLSHFKRSFTSIKSEGNFAIFQLFRYRAISLFVPRTNFKEFFRQMERTRSKNDSIGRNCNKSIVHRIEGYYVSRKGGSRKKHRSWNLYIYIYIYEVETRDTSFKRQFLDHFSRYCSLSPRNSSPLSSPSQAKFSIRIERTI